MLDQGRTSCFFLSGILLLRLFPVANGLLLRSPASPLWSDELVETLPIIPDPYPAEQLYTDPDEFDSDPYTSFLTPASYPYEDQSFGELTSSAADRALSRSEQPLADGSTAPADPDGQGSGNDGTALLGPDGGTGRGEPSTDTGSPGSGDDSPAVDGGKTQSGESEPDSTGSTDAAAEGPQEEEPRPAESLEETSDGETPTADDTGDQSNQDGRAGTGDGDDGGSGTEPAAASSEDGASDMSTEESKPAESVEEAPEGESPTAEETAVQPDQDGRTGEATRDSQDGAPSTESSASTQESSASGAPGEKLSIPPGKVPEEKTSATKVAASADEARQEAPELGPRLLVKPQVQGWTSEFLMKGGDHYRLLRHTDIQGSLSRQARNWRPAIDLLHNATSLFSALRARQAAPPPPRSSKVAVPRQPGSTPGQEAVSPAVVSPGESPALSAAATPPEPLPASVRLPAAGSSSTGAADEVGSSSLPSETETKSSESSDASNRTDSGGSESSEKPTDLRFDQEGDTAGNDRPEEQEKEAGGADVGSLDASDSAPSDEEARV
ncbi:rhoptry protein rop10 [Cystoisospora suis]|uniref:Rhoptry protein rop10 n=1 Tax=Cystoisospora suis TaxID=483139 RepID=A0A2C6KRR2_9APIC|nr:rhoptry protein rop10 [Cystoisospora suis]